jgi:hypothetical protein
MADLGKGILLLGLVLVAVGALLAFAPSGPWTPRTAWIAWLGRLPGDIRIERPGGSIYLPITTCLVISVVLSLLGSLFSRLR